MSALDGVYEDLERARTTAVLLECQVAQALTLHTPAAPPNPTRLCPTCITPWPCPTAQVLGVTVLDDDMEPVQ